MIRLWTPWINEPGSVVLIWEPVLARIYNLKPHDLLDLTPFQLDAFKDDNPQPLVLAAQ